MTILRARRLSSRRRSQPLRALVAAAAAASASCRRRSHHHRAGSPEGWGTSSQLCADWAPTFRRSHLRLSERVALRKSKATCPITLRLLRCWGAPKLGPRGLKRRVECTCFKKFANGAARLDPPTCLEATRDVVVFD